MYVLYCIVLYCIVLYCIVLYCIVLYCIVLSQKFSVAHEAPLLGQPFIFGQSFSLGHFPPICHPPEWVYLLSTRRPILYYVMCFM